MNSFKKIFEKRKAFIAYLTVGQRDINFTEQAALALIEGGVDILEVGVPFSDPVADGLIIQQAMSEAIQNGVSFSDVLSLVRRIKTYTNTPIVLFSYYNPLIIKGFSYALNKSALMGVDGLLLVDLPLEESSEYFKLCSVNHLDPISLISPSTSQERIRLINQQSNAFLYYVCRHGTTGIKAELPHTYADKMREIKSLSHQPVVTGFGIGDRQMASEALIHADGFVVGSAFVKAIADGATPLDLKILASEIDPR